MIDDIQVYILIPHDDDSYDQTLKSIQDLGYKVKKA